MSINANICLFYIALIGSFSTIVLILAIRYKLRLYLYIVSTLCMILSLAGYIGLERLNNELDTNISLELQNHTLQNSSTCTVKVSPIGTCTRYEITYLYKNTIEFKRDILYKEAN